MLLLLDNYDSFTYNLYDYICRCGAAVEVVRNDAIDVASIGKKYAGIILSPGPGQPKDAGKMMEVIQQYQNDLPIFGVCLGMQALGQHFGATLERASFPMHGKVSTLTFEEEHPMFQQVNKPLEACRYHSLILTNLEHTALQILAQTPKDEPMALAHHTLPIWAVQFHPEAILTPQGLKLINNWLTCFGLKDTKPVAV